MVFVIINEYERGLRFTLGSFSSMLGPGISLNLPILHHVIVVDTRTKTVKMSKQEAISRDNVPLIVNSVVYYRIVDAQKAVLKIADVDYAVLQYAQTAMRDIVGRNEMDHILSDRDRIANQVEEIVLKEVAAWGVEISGIKIQDIEMPEDMKRTMARQAEGERIRRSTIILAQGELEAARNYANAASQLARSPGALYLKTLQTLSTTISQEDAPTSIILVPSQLMKMVETFLSKK